jgi:Ca2+-binding RTX toxin-like protein
VAAKGSGVSGRTRRRVVGVGATVVLAVGSWHSTASAGVSVTCDGLPATIVATADNQTLAGTDGPDVISSAGHSGVSIMAGGGNDLVCSDGGDALGNAGQAVVQGGEGDDTLIGSENTIFCCFVLEGNDGNDTLVIRSGSAWLFPGAGDDAIHASGPRGTPWYGRFVMFGDDPVHDNVDGGVINVPHATVDGEGHDTFTGSLTFYGTPGSDRFTGGPGSDSFTASSYAPGTHDVIRGAGGDDVLADINATIRGGTGDDQLTAVGGTAFGGRGADYLRARDAGTLSGGAGRDVLTTWIDNDMELLPRPMQGDFHLGGGPGNDTIDLTSPFTADGVAATCQYRDQTPSPPKRCTSTANGGRGQDLLSFWQAFGDVHADLRSGKVTYAGGSSTVRGFENAQGSPGDDVLLGTPGPNLFRGGMGDDTLKGRGGRDVLQGGDGHDIAYGGPGHDQCTAEVLHSC